IAANAHGRYPIPELELEIGMLDGWVRFWHRGELLGLPADLQAEIDDLKDQLRLARKRAHQERSRADQERTRPQPERQQRLAAEAEAAGLRALLDKSGKPPTGP